MKPIKLGSFVPSKVMADIASFMDIDDAVKLSLSSPRANNVLFSHRALARKTNIIMVRQNWVSCRKRSLRPDDNSANKQILLFLRTISEVKYSLHWNYHYIDDNIMNELLRIKFTSVPWMNSEIDISFARITASSGKFRRFLEQNQNNVKLWQVFATPSLIGDQVLLWLNMKSTIKPMNLDGSYDQISTTITDDLLKSPKFLQDIGPCECRINIRGFLSLRLTFPAIQKLFEKMSSADIESYDMLTLGVIGYQEMSAVAPYWNRSVDNYLYRPPKTTLCYINNGSYVEFTGVVYNDGEKPEFGISLERNSNGVVENAIIPEDMVHPEAFEKYKGIVKILKSDTSIESVVQNLYRFEYLSFEFHEIHYQTNYLEISARIMHPKNSQNKDSQDIVIIKENVDRSSAENIIAKLLKACSSTTKLRIKTNDVYNPFLKMTDRLFTSLLEHAAHVTVENDWAMDLQLSNENLARLVENQTAGLFQKLRIELPDRDKWDLSH